MTFDAGPTRDRSLRFQAETLAGGVHRSLAFERALVRRLLRAANDPPVGVRLWDGEQIGSAAPGREIGRLALRDRGSLYRLLVNPEMEFGDLYGAGRLEIEGDLVAVLEALYRHQSRGKGFAEYVPRRMERMARGSLSSARRNIHHHYDIGNAFYQLWLDERMLYTCAYFANDSMSLEAAQVAKMDHVCRKLRLKPGESVVEAGCGWGSLSLHMAQKYGVKVRAFNISHEQIAFARQRAKEAGFGDRVEFVEDDYRTIRGRYDAFVSVGMLEHVGPANYRDLGKLIDRSLTAEGRGLIHTIGRHRPMRITPWIGTRIFPGARPPAISEICEIFEPWSFAVLDVENLRLHYAETLRHWLNRFEARSDEVRTMFDEEFVRVWRLYLAGSLAAFTTGWMQLYQVLFNRVTNNDVPMTREALYRGGA